MDKSPPPDLDHGVPLDMIPAEGVLAVTCGGKPWLLARVGEGISALGGTCTHLGAPLAEVLRRGDTLRCPWHHACFSLQTGEALEAPAFERLSRHEVRVEGSHVFLGAKAASPAAPALALGVAQQRIVVVGAGAAGFAAVDRLRTLGHQGPLTWLDRENDAPYDRTKLSKAYLSGKAKSDGLPLEDPDADEVAPRHGRVVAIDRQANAVELEGGERIGYDALLLCPGAEPRRPDLPGFERPDVHLLRSRTDADAILAALGDARRAVVVGAGFIGLEVAGSLRQRGLDVVVVATEAVPLAAKFGPELGRFVQDLHEDRGVVFRLGRQAKAWDGADLLLDDDTRVAADLVVIGLGVSPRLDLIEAAGLAIKGAAPVDATMHIRGAEKIWAAGDVAAFPDALTGDAIRVEHWVAAERMGQIAAASMLGLSQPWKEPPFFWSAHYDVNVRYVGHADAWDTIEVDGDLSAKDAEIRYVKDGRTIAVATVGRDMAALEAAASMRRSVEGLSP